MADVGLPCPDPPPTDREMQDVAFAAKMAMLTCLRRRKLRPGRTSSAGTVICAACGSLRAGRVPEGGDGSELRPWWHKHDGVPCPGTYASARRA